MVIEATPKSAAHLWRRAAFGATSAEIDQTLRDGIEATVAAMFDHRRAPLAGGPMRLPGIPAYDTEQLNLWFLRLAATSPTPAIERLTWFWHGHFATNLDKFEDPELLHGQLMTFRRHGLGRFDDLLKLMARDPAMILWLDLEKSVAGRPNENYARELMELFSLGVDGGYTQADVVETGRAFTGYSIRYELPPAVVLSAGLHDDGPKTILGETGRFDGDDVVDIIVRRPECHRFVASRLWTRYAGTVPPPGVVDELAAVFGRDLRIQDLVVAMFTHPAFYTDEVMSGLVAQPVETAAAALRGFGVELHDVVTTPIPDDDDDDDEAGGGAPWWLPLTMLEEMGQLVGLPPNVGGWPHNEPWLDATRSAGRLAAAVQFADVVADLDTPAVRSIRDAVALGAAPTVAAILSAFGVVEWSAETESAITSALSTDDDARPLAAAIAVAFTSPEVTLS